MATSERTTAATGSPEPATDSRSRVTIASYSSYGAAERAVDWLSDQGYAVEHVAIVGKGLRSVEQVTSRMSGGRAALIGAGEGALLGMLFALLFGLFFSGPDFGGLLLYSVVVGGLFGCTVGLFTYALGSDGQRDFVSDTSIEADHYEIQADYGVAEEARRLLASMPGRS
jgi:Heat induced stress protein YflT domain